MAKGKRKKRRPGSGRPVVAVDVESILLEVDALKSVLEQESAGPEWGTMQRLLLKAKVDPSVVARVVIGRDLAELDRIIADMRGQGTARDADATANDHVEPAPDVPEATLREAMKAFRKRMKLTRLDHESKLGRNPLTTGKAASFESILPPHQYPAEVWKALVARGELEATGQGFYKLPTIRPEF